MSTQALARKWRPRDFSTMVGQEHVVRALTHALASGRLHHAYLFTGTRGVGKTTLARILAKSLNCTGPDGTGGVTAEPCNACAACQAIDAGRFVDYIEMDAASNRGVEEMTRLLEQATYSPSSARFKIYTIDEVHMLSGHAFNAMLKTLEEPPEFVKFILATTDPQKIPVTVLSRCLQFNLKPLPAASIAERLAEVLAAESLPADAKALRALAAAARGSMRDALSLLDQAIAFGAGAPTQDSVREMLGAIDETLLAGLLEAVADGDAALVLARADEMAERGFAFSQALRDLAALLHRVAIVQAVPAAASEEEGDAVPGLARRLEPEQVQLLYQIALHGRDDLSLAPDEMAGFTMTLLRMIAFAPEVVATPAAQRPAALRAARPPRASSVVRTGLVAAEPARAPSFAGLRPATEGEPSVAAPLTAERIDWPALARRLPLSGLSRELAQRSELVRLERDALHLRVAVKALLEAGSEAKLRAAVSAEMGRPMRLHFEVGTTAGETAAARGEQERAQRQRQAQAAIYGDPVVRELIEDLGAQVNPDSIRPAGPEATDK